MDESVYLNYGNDALIAQNEFLNAASNNLEGYLAQQPWSNKRKDLFRKAYVDIMSRGVIGAENSTGIWNVLHNGNLIDLDSLPKKEKEMYGEAAYYIQLLMSKITPKAKEEKKAEDKKDLPLFDNKYFTTQFQGYIGNNMFGGRDWDRNSDWNVLDELTSDKIRGTTNRANKLADMLQGYISTLKEEDLNFEGSPFRDINDFKSRVNDAITALRTSDQKDDISALNAIGLKASDYLSTGADDIVEYNGELMTRAEALDKLRASEATTLSDLKKQEELGLQIKYTLLQSSENMYGHTPEELAKKYKSDSEMVSALVGFSALGPELTPDNWSDVVGAYKFYYKNGKLTDATQEELNLLKDKEGFLDVKLGDIKKLPGVDNFYFDTRTNRVILPILGEIQGTTGGEDLLLSLSPELKVKDYYNRPAGNPGEFSTAEWLEIGSVLGDIVSIVDPEPISAGVAALGSAGARHIARNQSPEAWSFGDVLGQIGDYATGLIGAIPIVGDAVLAAKVMKTLKRIGRFGAWKDILSNYPEIKDIWTNKIFGDESMTAGDWKALAEFFRGVVGHGRMNKHNLAERKILQERGVVSREAKEISGMRGRIKNWSQKTGFIRTAPDASTTTTPTLKVKIKGKDKVEEIDIKDRASIEEKLKKAGNDLVQKDKEIRDLAEVKEYAKNNNVKVEDISVVSETKTRNGGITRFTPSRRNVDESFGTRRHDVARGKDNFENWLRTRGTRSRMGYGSDKRIRMIDRALAKEYGLNYGQTGKVTTTTTTKKDLKQLEVKNPTPPPRPILPSPKDIQGGRDLYTPGNRPGQHINHRANLQEIANWIDSYGLNPKRGHQQIKGGYNEGSKAPAAGDYKALVEVGGKTYDIRFVTDADGKFTVKVGDLNYNYSKQLFLNARLKLSEELYGLLTKQKMEHSQLAKLLKAYKKHGILRQGGIIKDNRDAYTIVSEFLNKQK